MNPPEIPIMNPIHSWKHVADLLYLALSRLEDSTYLYTTLPKELCLPTVKTAVKAYLAAVKSSPSPWQPISSAPKDRPVLVNDTVGGDSPWVAAEFIETPEWSGLVYSDVLLSDAIPTGPKPTHWLDVPLLPEVEGLPMISTPIDGFNLYT
jgi:hypothetical protein